MAKRRSTKTIWVRIIAFGLVIIFLGGYVAQSTLDLLANREQKQEQTTHINVPFKAQGVVNIREGVPEGATGRTPGDALHRGLPSNDPGFARPPARRCGPHA